MSVVAKALGVEPAHLTANELHVDAYLLRGPALRSGRKPIAMWPLLVWAFKRELVRFSCGSLFRPRKVSQSSMAWAMAAGMSGERGGAEGMDYDFAPCCHPDALEVYSAVLNVIEAEKSGAERRQAFQLLIKHSEAAAVPCWDPYVPPPRIVPVLNDRGRVKHLYGKRNEALACEIVIENPIEEAERIRSEARARYAEWCRLVEAVASSLGAPECVELTRFSVSDLGFVREPWSDNPQPA